MRTPHLRLALAERYNCLWCVQRLTVPFCPGAGGRMSETAASVSATVVTAGAYVHPESLLHELPDSYIHRFQLQTQNPVQGLALLHQVDEVGVIAVPHHSSIGIEGTPGGLNPLSRSICRTHQATIVVSRLHTDGGPVGLLGQSQHTPWRASHARHHIRPVGRGVSRLYLPAHVGIVVTCIQWCPKTSPSTHVCQSDAETTHLAVGEPLVHELGPAHHWVAV